MSVRILWGPVCFLLAISLLMAGCASSNRTASDTQQIEQQLRSEARIWHGTPHRLGGTNRRGVDCSGLVQVVFSDLFGLSVPRTTEEQVNTGQRVRLSSLQPGDLVFFRPTPKSRHVGIYVGNGEFFHASTSQGVMISRLDESYWSRHYWTARRLLQSSYPTSYSSPSSTRTPDGW